MILCLMDDKNNRTEMLNGCTYCSDFFKVADVTAHEEGRRSHEEVQHSTR